MATPLAAPSSCRSASEASEPILQHSKTPTKILVACLLKDRHLDPDQGLHHVSFVTPLRAEESAGIQKQGPRIFKEK